MASDTPGFLRMCWPKVVLNLKTLFLAELLFPAPGPLEGRSYGELDAPLRFACFALAMLGDDGCGLRFGAGCEGGGMGIF